MPWLVLLLTGCRDLLVPAPTPLPPRPAAAWEQTLRDVVDDRGDVDYDALRARRGDLDAYVAWIGRRDALDGVVGQQTHAFWLNAFNALVLYQVIERDVRDSVNEVPSRLPWAGSRFWYGTAFVVVGRELSLWEIGHERVTHLVQDYRDFAALAVAARSGPPVRPELYEGKGIAAQLDDQMARFLSSDRGLRFSEDGLPLFNPVFDRYDDEIRLYTSGTDPCALAARHTTDDLSKRMRDLSLLGCPHGTFAFDWSLNRAAR